MKRLMMIALGQILPVVLVRSAEPVDKQIVPPKSLVVHSLQSAKPSVKQSCFTWSKPFLGTQKYLESLSVSEAAVFHLQGITKNMSSDPVRLQERMVHQTDHGPLIVKYKKTFNGIEIFREELNVVMNRQKGLVAISGNLDDVWSKNRFHTLEFENTASEAVKTGLSDLVGPLQQIELTKESSRHGYDIYGIDGSVQARVRLKKVYYRLAEGLHSAYYMEISLRSNRAGLPVHVGYVVSASRARVLFRSNKVHQLEPFKYRVYGHTGAEPAPASDPYCGAAIPHPTGTPNGYVPAQPCQQSLIELITTQTSNQDPWLADDATETKGNNVDAFFHFSFDTDNYYTPDSFNPQYGDFRAQLTGTRTFDYPYDFSKRGNDYFCSFSDPSGFNRNDPQLNAKIVQAFFVANYLHDLLYDHGFDEASGVAQQDNYGRGGRDSDPLLVFAGCYTTYASSKADGESPHLCIGRNGYTATNQDCSFCLSTFAHEWMHYMQHRLVGDTNGLNNPQGMALGEGWADFLGVLMITKEEHAQLPENTGWLGAFAMGAYINLEYCDTYNQGDCTGPAPGEDQAFYFGIRRYPYSADMSISPLTFRYIQNDVAWPDDIPHFIWKHRVDNAEGHNAGEIWASALWHCYHALLTDGRYTFEQAQSRMLTYLVAGLKATPIDPTFTEARDALLSVVAASDEGDFSAFKAAFGARGMGAGAISPPRYSIENEGVIESFVADGPQLTLISAQLDDSLGSDDADGILDVGEDGQLSLVLRNSGFENLSDIQVEVSAADCQFSQGSQQSTLAALAGQDLEIHFPVQLITATTFQALTFSITFEDTTAGLNSTTTDTTFHVHYDLHQTGVSDDAEYDHSLLDWQVEAGVTSRGGYPSRFNRWERKLSQDNYLYRIPTANAYFNTSLVSPWLKVSTDQDFVLQWQQAYQFQLASENGEGWIYVRSKSGDQTEKALSGQSAGYPVLGDESWNLGRQFAGDLVQVIFTAVFPTTYSEEDTGWLLDNLSIDGIDNTPFTEIHPHGGTAPDGNWPPTAAIAIQINDMQVQFNDMSQDTDGQIVAWTWDFGDGHTATVQNPEHTFSDPGHHLVTLIVEDDGGKISVAEVSLELSMLLINQLPYQPRFSDSEVRYYLDVPQGAQSLMVHITGEQGWVVLYARHGDPVEVGGPWAYDYYQSRFLENDSTEMTLTIENPTPGRWHLLTQGYVTEIMVEIVDVDNDENCGCAQESPGAYGLGLLLVLLLSLRRKWLDLTN